MIQIGQNVFVYRNVTKKCFSLRAMDGPEKGRVVGHASHVILNDCTFKVSEAGRQRVIGQRRKNVHAGVIGRIQSALLAGVIASSTAAEDVVIRGMDFKSVNYNPYLDRSFVTVDGTGRGRPIHDAEMVILGDNGVFLAGNRIST